VAEKEAFAVHDFTPWSSLAGGVLIGAAASLLWLGIGRVAGVSGVLFGALLGPREERLWRALFLVGLVLGGLALGVLLPGGVGVSPRPLGVLAVAGLLVGFGTRVGGGCTSGHGVCGVSRLAPRSLVATAVFVGAGILVATLYRLIGGGA
jgi:uncharacterized membrane protein YedE/YeeE